MAFALEVSRVLLDDIARDTHWQSVESKTHRVSSLLKVVADTSRLRALSLLVQAGSAGLRQQELAEALGLKTSTVVHHVNILQAGGLAKRVKKEGWLHVIFTPTGLEGIYALVKELEERALHLEQTRKSKRQSTS